MPTSRHARWRAGRACAWLAVLFTAAAVAAPVAQPAAGAEYRWQGVDRVVAFADVHGAYDALVRLLEATAVIDDAGRWVGGTTHLVSLGDLLDRGDDSRRVMDLLQRLEVEARAAGGRVHRVLGNHELMNLTGDLRYVSAGEFAAFAEGASTDVPPGFAAHRRAFSLAGSYGRWLVDTPVLIVVNDTAYVHGGLPASVLERGVDGLNRDFRTALSALLEAGDRARALGLVAADEDLLEAGVRLAAEPRAADLARLAANPLFGEAGPLWYRGTAQCHALIEGDRVARALATLGVARVVLGHTPTPQRRAATRFDGRVILLDTGMLAAVYKGRASALVSEHGTDHIVTEAGAATLEALAEVPGDAPRGRGREAAALAIDRLLGLGIVDAARAAEAPTVEPGGQSRWISERERVAQGLVRPNPCEVGSDYLLMTAFDALIGNRGRSLDNLGYDRSTWALALRDHARAFGRGGLGAVASPPGLPRALRDRLMDLELRVLDDVVGEWLGRREIAAVLARRDEIVKNWPILE